MNISIVKAIAEAINTTGKAVESYFKSRKEVYRERQYLRLKRATNEAEQGFETSNEIINLVRPLVLASDNKDLQREFNGHVLTLKRIIKRFNKYD